MRRFGRTDLLRWRRPEPVVMRSGGRIAVLKDQAPLIERNIALSPDWQFADFVQYQNEHVFFWPGTADGAIKAGVRLRTIMRPRHHCCCESRPQNFLRGIDR